MWKMDLMLIDLGRRNMPTNFSSPIYGKVWLRPGKTRFMHDGRMVKDIKWSNAIRTSFEDNCLLPNRNLDHCTVKSCSKIPLKWSVIGNLFPFGPLVFIHTFLWPISDRSIISSNVSLTKCLPFSSQ